MSMSPEDNPYNRDSFASTPTGDLIEGGVQFSFTDENTFEPNLTQELDLLEMGVYDTSLFEIGHMVHSSTDMEFDEFDPGLEARSSYWAGPWEKDEQPVLLEDSTKVVQHPILGRVKVPVAPPLDISPQMLNRALRLYDQINAAEPWNIVQGYFGTTKTVNGERRRRNSPSTSFGFREPEEDEMTLLDLWTEAKRAEDHYRKTGKDKLASTMAQASLLLRRAAELDAGAGEVLVGIQTDNRGYAGKKR